MQHERFVYVKVTSDEPVAPPPERTDLRIRSLLDDPRLRRSMGLPDPGPGPADAGRPPVAPTRGRATPASLRRRFDRRRLLDDDAA